jgi:hypothetical protein
LNHLSCNEQAPESLVRSFGGVLNQIEEYARSQDKTGKTRIFFLDLFYKRLSETNRDYIEDLFEIAREYRAMQWFHEFERIVRWCASKGHVRSMWIMHKRTRQQGNPKRSIEWIERIIENKDGNDLSFCFSNVYFTVKAMRSFAAHLRNCPTDSATPFDLNSNSLTRSHSYEMKANELQSNTILPADILIDVCTNTCSYMLALAYTRLHFAH